MLYGYEGSGAGWRRKRARLAAMTLLLMLLTFSPFQPSAGPVGGTFARVVGAPVAAEAITLWDGVTMTEPTQTGGIYMITKPEELAWIAGPNGVLSGSYKLLSDINLNGKSWTPIGATSTSSFTGTFDGDGRVVYGLSVTNDGGRVNFGLFGYVGGSAQISKLHIAKHVLNVTRTVTSVTVSAGALAGTVGASATVSGCSASGSTMVSVEGDNPRVGGLVGECLGTISGSSSGGSVVVIQSKNTNSNFIRVGGLLGSLGDTSNNPAVVSGCASSVVLDCAVDTEATSHSTVMPTVGGLIGLVNPSGVVKNCSASGNVNGAAQNAANIQVGGLIGEVRGTAISGSASGNVGATGGSGAATDPQGRLNAGALIGYTSGGTVSQSHSTGNVTADFKGGYMRAALLSGYLNNVGSDLGTIRLCAASGVFTATDASGSRYAGGLASQTAGNTTTPDLNSLIEKSYVYAPQLTASTSNKGALVGTLAGTLRNNAWLNDNNTLGGVGATIGTNPRNENNIGLSGTDMKDVTKFTGAPLAWDDFNTYWSYSDLDNRARPHLKGMLGTTGNTVSPDMLMAAPLHVAVRSNDTAYVNLLAAGFEKLIGQGTMTFTYGGDGTPPANVSIAQHPASNDVIVLQATGAVSDDVKLVTAKFKINNIDHEIPFTLHRLEDTFVQAAVTFSPAAPSVSGTVGSAVTPLVITASPAENTTLGVMTHGVLPGGITVTQNYTAGAATGTITVSGSPTAAGSGTFTITVPNSAGASSTVTVSYSFATSGSAVTFSPAAPTVSGTVGSAVTPVVITLTPLSGTTLGTISFDVLPGGITVSQDYTSGDLSGTITVSGTPTAVASSTFPITVWNSAGGVGSVTVTYTFKAPGPGPSPDPGPNPTPNPTPTPPDPAPEPEPVDYDVTPADDGTVDEQITVTDTSGNAITVTDIPETPANTAAETTLGNMGLSIRVENGKVVVSGTAVDIGDVTFTVNVVGANGKAGTTTVRIQLHPILHDTGPAVDTFPSGWNGSMSTTTDDSGNKLYTFTLFVPLDIAAHEATLLREVGATANNARVTGTEAVDAVERQVAKGAENAVKYVKITGETDTPDNARITSVTYRLGIHRYTQQTDVVLADTGAVPDDEPLSSSSSSGCDAGAAGILALFACALIARGRKDRK